MGLLFNNASNLVMKDALCTLRLMYSTPFLPVLTDLVCLQACQVPRSSSRVCGSKALPTVEEDRVHKNLSQLDIPKSMELDI